ncbi:MAG: arylsulfatase [Bacteroidales bacterium]|nr:arylsulfatase [Bacteroidales bacterium]MBN2634068.1 arylsulfatase [Bacteroidales bacterium]
MNHFTLPAIRFGIVAAGMAGFTILNAQQHRHPNVVLIITDDQGYGDFGFTGNPHVRTPVLDNFARESIRFSNFYVCPVSAPTRAALMTGRYSLRTGVRDTYNGGAMMAASEVTIAELLKSTGYATGHFGKWHLGDNYPMRPVDQGFDESVMHLGGGMGQPGDFTTWPRRDSSYFDPVLWHNGKQEKYVGYCTDIFTSAAMDFIEENHKRPFFCYLAYNAPHTPLQVPQKYYDLYRDTDPAKGFENDSRPFPKMNDKNREDARRVYAMVANLDENIGKLLEKLDELDIADNTVVIFMTDNGPQQIRYNAGMRGLKSSVYRGGVRVPFWIRYPKWGRSDLDIRSTAANIDVFPTIADICNADVPAGIKLDGISLLPLIKGEEKEAPERTLFFYWTRHSPELYNNIALLKGKDKLVGQTGYNAAVGDFQLFDVEKDPYEQNNMIKEFPEKAAALKDELEKMFYDLAGSHNMIERPVIHAGTEYENPVYLNRNDADGQWGIWEQEEVFGFWRMNITEGHYNLRFKFIKALPPRGKMMVETGGFISQFTNENENTDLIEMKNVYLPSLKCDFVPFYLTGGKKIFPLYVEIEKME